MSEEAAEVASCSTCQGYGFRVLVAPGVTLNVKSATENGLMHGTQRILCQCQIAKEEIKVPAFQAAPKKPQRLRPKQPKKTVVVAGTKPSAYVDPADSDSSHNLTE